MNMFKAIPKYICVYTILNNKTGIRDYTTSPQYAEVKSRQGYIVYGNLVLASGITKYKRV